MPDKAKKTYNKFKEQINYMLFGGLTTVVNMAAYYLLLTIPWFRSDDKVILFSEEYTLGYITANTIAYIIAMTFSYIVNRNYVFRHKVYGKGAIARQFLLFLVTRIIALAAETSLLYYAVEHIGISKYVAKWPVAIFMVLINYPFGKFLVFRDREKKKGAKDE